MAAEDDYATGAFRWWHLDEPPPELIRILKSGWPRPPGRVLDLGCGQGTEAGHLAATGFSAWGIDLSPVALGTARRLHPLVHLVRGDVRRLPFPTGSFDFALDRGTFHYLDAAGRRLYASELHRVLRPRGRFLLRACLQTQGRRNHVDPDVILQTFRGWRVESLEPAEIPSDTRSMPALVAKVVRD